MNVPALVTARLGDETPLAHVPLGGDDAVYVTPTRTLVYRADGLLSDESVAAFPHDAERIDLRRSRRKATVQLTYVDEAREFTVPAPHATRVLRPVLGGVLRARGVVETGERVAGAFLFSELLLVVTEARVVKHVGSALWDADYEAFPFEDLTGLDYEEGRVATQVVLEIDGRPHRVKVPNDEFGRVRKTIEEVVFAFHGVGSREALDEKVGIVEQDESDSISQFTSLVGDSDGDEDADGDEDETATTESAETTDEPPAEEVFSFATDDADDALDATASSTAAPDLAEEVEALRTAVEHQNQLLERQAAIIEQLVAELRRGR